jgi:predicted AlkP superfamily pyrophosphatase or phosphodiesterase
MEKNELYKVAELIDNCEIPEEDFIDLSLNEFLKTKGKVYFDINKKYFYKNLEKQGKWFRYKNLDENFINWANEYKEYSEKRFNIIDNEINKLKSNQEESLKLINEFMDMIQKVKLEDPKIIKELPKVEIKKRGRPKRIQ